MHKHITQGRSKASQAVLLGLALIAGNAQAAGDDFAWGYGPDNGPHVWGDYFPTCHGNRQSPIDIMRNATTRIRGAEINTEYRSRALNVESNGHTIQVNVAPGSTLRVGLKTYQLLQFHFHTGSEHTVEGAQAPLEVHLVHMDSNGRLAVLGFFFKAGNHTNAVLETVIAHAPHRIGKQALDVDLDYSDLLPDDEVSAYYNYSGSLTTPPCTEGVNWLVAKATLSASHEQIQALRELMVHHGDIGNFRPPQALNDREVRNVGRRERHSDH